jgi:hypothetical protein
VLECGDEKETDASAGEITRVIPGINRQDFSLSGREMEKNGPHWIISLPSLRGD